MFCFPPAPKPRDAVLPAPRGDRPRGRSIESICGTLSGVAFGLRSGARQSAPAPCVAVWCAPLLWKMWDQTGSCESVPLNRSLWSRWNGYYGFCGWLCAGLCAGLLYVCAEVLLRACPTHLSLSSAKLNPAQFMSRTMMYHDIPSWWISAHKGFPFIRDFPV